MLLSLLVAAPCLFSPAPMAQPALVEAVQTTDQIDWFRGELFAIRAKAKAENKAILFVVFTDESSWCDKLFQQSLSDPAVIAETVNLVCVKVNMTRDQDGKVLDNIAEKIASRFPVRSFPTLFFLGTNVAPEDLIEGFIPPANLASELQRMKAGTNTLSFFRDAVAAAPDDVDALWNLAGKVNDFGYVTEYQEIMARIQVLDPEERSRPLRERKLLILEEQLFRAYTASGVYEFAKLTAFLDDEPNPSVAYQGWSTLAGLVRSLRDSSTSKKEKREMGELSRDSHKNAWAVVAPGSHAAYGITVLNDFFEDRSELKRKDRIFCKTVTDAFVEAVAKRTDTPNIQAIICDAQACAAAIAKDKSLALEWIDKAIALDPSTPSYGQRRDAIDAMK